MDCLKKRLISRNAYFVFDSLGGISADKRYRFFSLERDGKDVKRLETIAERFSKIGSNPDPVPVDINNSIRSALSYMSTRISSKVKIYTHLTDGPVPVLMNDSLFAWVIENLTKNAVDAMEGQGKITFQVEERDKVVRIDVTDTGKGIAKSKFKTVFNPGYTTKSVGGARLVSGKAYYRILSRRKDIC